MQDSLFDRKSREFLMLAKSRKTTRKIDRILAELEKSQLSICEFSKLHGLKSKSVYNWRWNRARKNQLDFPIDAAPIEVSITKPTPIFAEHKIKLSLKSGHAFEFPAGTSADFMVQIAEALR